MIGTTHLFITHTFLDTQKRNGIAFSYLQQLSNGLQPRIVWETFMSQLQHTQDQSEALFHKSIVEQKLLVPELTKKEDFREFFAEIYTKHTQPVVIILGDLSQIDDSAQEGMLKVLEEPPEHVTLVLFAHHTALIKPTIRSRSVLHTFPLGLIVHLLDAQLVEETKTLLPDYRETLQRILKLQPIELKTDIKKIERNHISFWLWQLTYYIEQLGMQQSLHIQHLRNRLQAVLTAMYLNEANVQKKLLFEQVSLSTLER